MAGLSASKARITVLKGNEGVNIGIVSDYTSAQMGIGILSPDKD